MKRLVHQRETPEQMQNVRCFLHQCSSSNNQSIGGLLASSAPSVLIYNIQVPLHIKTRTCLISVRAFNQCCSNRSSTALKQHLMQRAQRDRVYPAWMHQAPCSVFSLWEQDCYSGTMSQQLLHRIYMRLFKGRHWIVCGQYVWQHAKSLWAQTCLYPPLNGFSSVLVFYFHRVTTLVQNTLKKNKVQETELIIFPLGNLKLHVMPPVCNTGC